MAKESSPARLRSQSRTVLTRPRTASYQTRVLGALPKHSAVRNAIGTRHAVAVEVMHLAAQRTV